MSANMNLQQQSFPKKHPAKKFRTNHSMSQNTSDDIKWIPDELRSTISDTNNDTHKLILRSSESIFLVDCESESSTAKSREFYLPTAKIPPTGNLEIEVRASCNGLLWISVNDEDILWDPFTGGQNRIKIGPCDAYGFAYHPTTKNYKIIYYSPSDVEPPICSKPSIYSVKNDSYEVLTEKDIELFQRIGFTAKAGICIKNGSFLYWPGFYSCENGYNCVVCQKNVGNLVPKRQHHPIVFGFNLDSRNHVIIPQPPGWILVTKIIDFMGSLCAVKHVYGEHIEMWILKDEMVSWVKLMNFSYPGSELGILEPIFIRRNGEVLMNVRCGYGESKNALYAYNSTERTLRRVEVDGVGYWYDEIKYNERTLALPESSSPWKRKRGKVL